MLGSTRGYRPIRTGLHHQPCHRRELDFTFVGCRTSPAASSASSRWTVPPSPSRSGVRERHPAPRGPARHVVLQDNRVRRQDESLVHYTSDTEPGSSGSCVFNNLWTPVALHHASRPAARGRAGGFAYLNEGIKFTAIATHLEQVMQQGGADRRAAEEVLAAFDGSDALLGFFGSPRSHGRRLGRPVGDRRDELSGGAAGRRRGLLEHRMVQPPAREDARRGPGDQEHEPGRLGFRGERTRGDAAARRPPARPVRHGLRHGRRGPACIRRGPVPR